MTQAVLFYLCFNPQQMGTAVSIKPSHIFIQETASVRKKNLNSNRPLLQTW
jgi:hypothetical protein